MRSSSRRSPVRSRAVSSEPPGFVARTAEAVSAWTRATPSPHRSRPSRWHSSSISRHSTESGSVLVTAASSGAGIGASPRYPRPAIRSRTSRGSTPTAVASVAYTPSLRSTFGAGPSVRGSFLKTSNSAAGAFSNSRSSAPTIQPPPPSRLASSSSASGRWPTASASSRSRSAEPSYPRDLSSRTESAGPSTSIWTRPMFAGSTPRRVSRVVNSIRGPSGAASRTCWHSSAPAALSTTQTASGSTSASLRCTAATTSSCDCVSSTPSSGARAATVAGASSRAVVQ